MRHHVQECHSYRTKAEDGSQQNELDYKSYLDFVLAHTYKGEFNHYLLFVAWRYKDLVAWRCRDQKATRRKEVISLVDERNAILALFGASPRELPPKQSCRLNLLLSLIHI